MLGCSSGNVDYPTKSPFLSRVTMDLLEPPQSLTPIATLATHTRSSRRPNPSTELERKEAYSVRNVGQICSGMGITSRRAFRGSMLYQPRLRTSIINRSRLQKSRRAQRRVSCQCNSPLDCPFISCQEFGYCHRRRQACADCVRMETRISDQLMGNAVNTLTRSTQGPTHAGVDFAMYS